MLEMLEMVDRFPTSKNLMSNTPFITDMSVLTPPLNKDMLNVSRNENQKYSKIQ